jgi:hypothetical protein
MKEGYRPVSPRQRAVIVLVAVATALAVGLLIIEKPGGKPRVAAPAPACTGTMENCVGGKASVFLVPAAGAQPTHPASAAPR